MTEYAGPAVQLANAESIFPHLLAAVWRRRGLETYIVSATAPRRLPPEAGPTPIIDVSLDQFRFGGRLKAAAKRLATPFHRAAARAPSDAFRERTGLTAPQPWETMLMPHIINGLRVARAARRLRPLFVFGHEVTAYGLATAWVRDVPRILFPWGADVMSTAEVSPRHFRLARYALHAADLVVPSSMAAARHIERRFGVPPEKIRAVSWGADLDLFRPASAAERAAICARYGLSADRPIVLNARRFLPMYSCTTVVRAFIELARRRSDCQFVLLGGRDTDPYVDEAIGAVRAEGEQLANRVVFLRDNIPLRDCADLMSISDVFLSLCGRVDMRSKSVLEAAAAGGVPVLAEDAEYRSMQVDGFAAEFVAPDDATMVAGAVEKLLDAPDRRQQIRQQNATYLARYENSVVQMDALLDHILAVVERHRNA